MNENQKRTIHYSFKATPEEDAMIQKKMELAGIKNQSAFIRRIVLGGLILRLDLPELTNAVRLMGSMDRIVFHLQIHFVKQDQLHRQGHDTACHRIQANGHRGIFAKCISNACKTDGGQQDAEKDQREATVGLTEALISGRIYADRHRP